MIEALATIAACSLAARVKGGGPRKPREWLESKGLNFDGHIVSALLFGVICAFWVPWPYASCMMLGWFLGWKPDIGDRIEELRHGNWRLSLQRGFFLGGCISLGAWDPSFILAGAFFPVAYWLSLKINSRDWFSAEYMMGAAIGLALVISNHIQ